MARRHENVERISKPSFPAVVAGACTAVAVFLYFGNTVDAKRERENLLRIEREVQELTTRYGDKILAERAAAGVDLARDPQALLSAIDRLDLTPEELLREYPALAEATRAPN